MPRAWLAASAALLFTFAAAPVAGAEPLGPFAPLGCFEDDVNVPLRCAAGRQLVDLRTPQAIDVSPDSKQVYVGIAGSGDLRGGIAIFGRSTATGELTPAGCVEDAEAGTALSCATTAMAVGRPRDLAVSPDGKSVYTVTDQGGTIARLDRDPATGALTYVDCFEATDGTRCGPGRQVAGLIALNGIVVSPDGTSVYTFALSGSPGPGGRGAVARFGRDPGTGALDYQDCLGPSGTVGCTVTAAPIDGAWDGAMSVDSKSLYVSGNGDDDAVAHFSRNSGNGALTPQACVERPGGSKCALETPAFFDPSGLVVSPDGRSVYVTAAISGTVTRMDRDLTTGALTPAGCFRTDEASPVAGCTPVTGLRGAIDVRVSPDGSRVYVSGRESAALVDFVRDPSTGALTYDGCVNAPVSSVTCGGATAPGLADTFSFAVSPDGNGLFAAGLGDNALVVFGAPGAADTPPTAVADAVTVAQDSGAITLDVLANDTDPDGGPKQVVSVTDPARGTTAVTGGGGGLSYRPDAGSCGPDSFSYVLNGGSAATVSVAVTCASAPPGSPGGPATPAPPIAPSAPIVPEIPATTPVAIGCAPDTLILTDVFPRGTRTQLLGVAPASAVGQRVAIVSAWDRRTVARAVVRPDLTFEATAPLPPRAIRATDKARFSATLGARKSAALKFARRAYTTSVRVSGRSVTFTGLLTKPLAAARAPVVVRASGSCASVRSGTVVATVKPTAAGTFVARFDVPGGRDVIYLRAESSVRRTARSAATSPTFTLIRGIRFGG